MIELDVEDPHDVQEGVVGVEEQERHVLHYLSFYPGVCRSAANLV